MSQPAYKLEDIIVEDSNPTIRERIFENLDRFFLNHSDIFFVQDRVGEDGRLFSCYKFRTMEKNTKSVDETISIGRYGQLINENSIIESRRWLRIMKLDELPQIINFLKGDLKLVGPRAPVLDEFLRCPDDIKEHKIKYKPGVFPITLYSRDIRDYGDKIDIERKYFERYDQPGLYKRLYVDYCVYLPRILFNWPITVVEGLSKYLGNKLKHLALKESKSLLNKLASLF